jgi:hypothetical protein
MSSAYAETFRSYNRATADPAAYRGPHADEAWTDSETRRRRHGRPVTREADIVAARVAAEEEELGSTTRLACDSGAVYGTEGLRFES